MLQAYLDDSGTHGGPYCFLAGYLATTERWEAFAKQWHEICIEYLGTRPFKTCAAYREKDPGFVPEKGRLRLAECIVKHVEMEVWSALPEYDALRIQNKYGIQFDKYWTCFLGVIEKAIGDFDLRSRKERLAWIFDHQGGAPPDEQSALEYSLIRAFNDYRRVAVTESKPLLHSISFADDEAVCQLQAADFLAWHKRRRHADGADIPDPPAYEILAAAPIHRIEAVWFDHKLEDLIRRITEPYVAP